MKLKKILIATLTIVPTVALISASCGNTQNLDALKDFISKTKLSDILDGAEQVDSPKKAEDLEEGKKQVSNKAVDEFNKALDEAKKVNDESNAKQALDKLKKAIENLKNAIVVGKMKLVGDLGRLRNWLNDNTADKLLEGVEVVDVLSKPDPTTIPTGLKQIQKIEKDKFVEVWNKLDKITEEDKAKAGLTELSDAVKALKAAIVVGTKEMPLGWFDPKDEAISENILNKYFTVNKEGTLTKKSGTSLQNIKKEVARLIIPGTLNGKQIKKIGSYLFYETDKIKDVIFKEKIEETYSLVFGSSKVRRVVFLKNVDKTGNGIFDIANPAINHKFLEVAFSDDQEFTTYTEKDRSTFMNAKISKLVKLGKISQVPENFFFNAEIDELRLPETVTKIHVDGFKNAKIDKLIIKKDLYLANSAAFAKAHINQIEWIGGGAATPQLDKLLNLINDSTVDKILHKGRKAKILDSTSKPSADTLYKDWKVVLKSAVTTYEAALAEARAVKDESKADAAIAKLNLAIDAFKAEIVVGTKEFDGYFTDGELQTSIELLEKYLNVDGTTLSTNNENKYLKEENGKMHLSKLVIPNELGGREIDEVHQAILRDLTFVDDVVFTNKFDAIYYASFQKSKFKRVIFLDNINLLGQQTFDGCDIDEVIFAENQGDFSTKPGAEIHKIKWFKNAKIGKLVKLGKITTIGALVFDNAQIGELRLPETVTTIDKTAFQNATINKLIIKKSTYEANEAKILQANIATIEFIEGGSPVKKPNLKKLYTLLLSPEADVNEILRDVEVLDQPNKPNSSEVASGKKVVRKLAKEEYIAAYNEALAVNDESKADATIAKLQAAIQKLKDEIVTGVGSWKNQLKDLIYSAEINVILKEVEILSETIVTKPNPDEIEKGVKAILWSDKEAYKKVLDEAKLAQNDEVKAKDAFDKLKAAIQDLKTKFIIGTHEGPIIPADAPYTLQDLEKSIEIINTYLGVDSSNLMLVKAYGAKYLKDYKGGTIEKFVLPKWIRGSQNNQKDKKFKWNSIWQGVFNDVKYIKELIICPRIEASEYQGFGYNSKFEVVRFLENVDRIHSEMFADTQIQELIFSDNQTDFDTEGEYYKGNAFSHANIGKLVKLGKITKIPAFFFASSNIGELRLPETVKEINYTAFQNATINKLVISKALYLNHKDALAQAKEIKTIEFIEGGSPTATPKLDALKTYISENTPTIVFKNVILTDAAPVASEIEKGKKGLKKSDAKLFEDAYNKAFNLTDEAQADAVLAEFKAAKTAVESAMVAGTKVATPNLDALKELIKNSSVDKLLAGVDQVDVPKAASELEKGKKQIAKSEVTKYEAALNTAKEVTEEDKALAAKQTLQNAIDTLKSKIVEGIKVSTPNLDALRELIKNSSVDKLLVGVDQVDTPKAASELEKGKKQIAKSEVTKYEAALAEA
ncbi:leucine rich repeat (LRR) protein, partial [Metamycoplasma subdolum]